MNQSCITRNPGDLWLNVGDLERVLLICATPLNNKFNNCLTLKFHVSGQRSLLLPTSSGWLNGSQQRCTGNCEGGCKPGLHMGMQNAKGAQRDNGQCLHD